MCGLRVVTSPFFYFELNQFPRFLRMDSLCRRHLFVSSLQPIACLESPPSPLRSGGSLNLFSSIRHCSFWPFFIRPSRSFPDLVFRVDLVYARARSPWRVLLPRTPWWFCLAPEALTFLEPGEGPLSSLDAGRRPLLRIPSSFLRTLLFFPLSPGAPLPDSKAPCRP